MEVDRYRRHSKDDDALLSPADYLQKHDVAFYLRDVTALLLQARDEHPLDFIAEYFSSVLNGTHVLLREYAYVSRSPRDRWAFIASAREALADLDQSAPTSAQSLTQLLRLVCHDFPDHVAVHACRMCGDERGSHALDRLLHAACVLVCFSEFFEQAADAFQARDSHQAGRADRVMFGRALRQLAAALPDGRAPPEGCFNELVGASGNVSLGEVEQFLAHSSEMYGLFAEAGPSDTLVASPPRDSVNSPGTSAAVALAASSPNFSCLGARRHAGARGTAASRERLAEAAAVALAASGAAVSGAGGGGAVGRRARGGSAGGKRRQAGGPRKRD